MIAGTVNNEDVLMKTDTETNIIWTSPGITTPTHTIIPSILEKENGEIILIATSMGMAEPIPAYSTIYTYNASGELLSSGQIDDPNNDGRVLRNAYLFGNELLGLSYTTIRSSLIKYLPDGTLLWEKPMNLPEGFYADHLIFRADSSLIANNQSYWGAFQRSFLHGMSISGDSLWTRIFRNDNISYNFDIKLCPDAGFLLSMCSIINGVNSPYLVKTDSNGETVNVGINNKLVTDAIRVYPNPAIDRVIFDSSEPLHGIISIIDMSGRKIASFRSTGLKTEWHTGGLKPGMYYYKIENKGDILTGRLIIGL